MAHIKTYIARANDPQVVTPADANITGITVDGGAAPHTKPVIPSRAVITTPPNAGQVVAVTYDPVLQGPPPFMGQPCYWNPLDAGASWVFQPDNLTVSKSAALTWTSVRGSTSHSSGKKRYFEISSNNTAGTSSYVAVGVGTALATLANYPGFDANGWAHLGGGSKANNGITAYSTSFGANPVIGVYVDLETNPGTIGFLLNNVDKGLAFSSLDVTKSYFPLLGLYTTGISVVGRFKTSDFIYGPPSGYTAWE